MKVLVQGGILHLEAWNLLRSRYKVIFISRDRTLSTRAADAFMRLAFLTLLAAFLMVPRADSQAGNSQNNCSLHGTVSDSKTGQPIKGAEVTLRGGALGSSGSWNGGANASEPASAISDAEGHFSFDNLAPGRYRAVASRNGYISRDPRFGAGLRSSVIMLSSGQSSEITLRLIPSAVIAGRVTVEGDEAVPNVSVQAMKYTYVNERRQLSDIGTATTNDRGEYRIWGLAPGKYYIRATHPRGSTVRPGAQVFVPVFYPGVTDVSRTQPLELHPGDEMTGIDVNFTSQHSVRLSGRVLNASSQGDKGAQVTLIAGSGSMSFPAGQASADAKGTFEIRGVAPGSYTLLAEQYGNGESEKVMRGRTAVEVGDVNLNDVEVTTGPGAGVSGHVKIEGKSNPDLSRLNVGIEAQDDLASLGFGPDVSNVPVHPDGTFSFHDVPEGTYRINVAPLPNGYYLKPGGEGDAVESGVRVGHNRSAAVELTLSAGAGRVTGSVTKKQQACAGATVVLIPDAPRRGQTRLYRQALTDNSGNFTLANVTPGDYKLFAWEEIERGMYLDPDFMQTYDDLGKSVHVDEGGNANATLDVIPATD
jgi:protocatechuate 3,4-dioxygenase beta subunit